MSPKYTAIYKTLPGNNDGFRKMTRMTAAGRIPEVIAVILPQAAFEILR